MIPLARGEPITRDGVIALTEAVRGLADTGDPDLDAVIVEAANRVLVALKRHGWTAETGYETAFVLRRLEILIRIHEHRLSPVTAASVAGILGDLAKVFGG